MSSYYDHQYSTEMINYMSIGAKNITFSIIICVNYKFNLSYS